MFPPKLAAPLKVTKSPVFAPCPASVTVIVEDPFTAAKVAVLVVVVRSGVMLYYCPPVSMYT